MVKSSETLKMAHAVYCGLAQSTLYSAAEKF